jgi:hyperosmotically inducible protein
MLALLLVFSGCAGIQSPPGEETYLDDETITSRVQQALAESLGAQISSIKVQTFKGVVLLSGEVASENLRKRAVAITGDVEGVEFVKDKLELTGPGR